MALSASLAELISTKPKPRDRPVSRSVTTVADSHVPSSEKSVSRSALVVLNDRFPTKIFLPMANAPAPAGPLVVLSRLPEREARSSEGATEGRAQTRRTGGLSSLSRPGANALSGWRLLRSRRGPRVIRHQE